MNKWVARIVILGILPALVIVTTLTPQRFSPSQEFVLSQFDTMVTVDSTFVLFQSEYPFTINSNNGYSIPAEAAYLDAFNLAAGLSYHLVDTLPAGEWLLRHSGTVSVFLFDNTNPITVTLYPTIIKLVLVLGITAFFWSLLFLAFLSQARDFKRYPVPSS